MAGERQEGEKMTIGEGLFSIAIVYLVVHVFTAWANYYLYARATPSLDERVKKIEDMLKDML